MPARRGDGDSFDRYNPYGYVGAGTSPFGMGEAASGDDVAQANIDPFYSSQWVQAAGRTGTVDYNGTPVNMAVEDMGDFYDKTPLTDAELKAAIESGNLGKLYAQVLTKNNIPALNRPPTKDAAAAGTWRHIQTLMAQEAARVGAAVPPGLASWVPAAAAYDVTEKKQSSGMFAPGNGLFELATLGLGGYGLGTLMGGAAAGGAAAGGALTAAEEAASFLPGGMTAADVAAASAGVEGALDTTFNPVEGDYLDAPYDPANYPSGDLPTPPTPPSGTQPPAPVTDLSTTASAKDIAIEKLVENGISREVAAKIVGGVSSSVLGKILSGAATAADWASIIGAVGSMGLGVAAAKDVENKLNDLATKTMGGDYDYGKLAHDAISMTNTAGANSLAGYQDLARKVGDDYISLANNAVTQYGNAGDELKANYSGLANELGPKYDTLAANYLKAGEGVYNTFLGMGEPYRANLEETFKPGYNLWANQAEGDAANQAASDSARQWAAKTGNLFDSPTGQAGVFGDVLNRTYLPQLNTMRGQLGQFGQIGIPQAGTMATQGLNTWADIGKAGLNATTELNRAGVAGEGAFNMAGLNQYQDYGEQGMTDYGNILEAGQASQNAFTMAGLSAAERAATGGLKAGTDLNLAGVKAGAGAWGAVGGGLENLFNPTTNMLSKNTGPMSYADYLKYVQPLLGT